MNTYINTLISNGTIQYSTLIEEYENGTARALFGYQQFETIVEKEVFIKQINGEYTHLRIKKKFVYDDSDISNIVQKINEVEERVSVLSLLLIDGLPKTNESVNSYKNDKTNIVIDSWKDFIVYNPSIVDPKIKDGLTNLLIDDIFNRN